MSQASASQAAPVKRTMGYNQLSSCPDMEPEFADLYHRIKPFTMTSLERVYGLYKAVEYVVRRGIPGDMVECGVWKGGSAMAIALTLKKLDASDRGIWLYDTFAGMTEPTERDVQYDGVTPHERMAQANLTSFAELGCVSVDEVEANIRSTGYPPERVKLIKGDVLETIPLYAPGQIALLRLDTDWHASTAHELKHLYPRLARGGVLIIDDYGHWRGARQAVDEYFAAGDEPVLLNRLDYTGRIAIRT